MRTRIVLSLVDGAKAEYREMKEKCTQGKYFITATSIMSYNRAAQ